MYKKAHLLFITLLIGTLHVSAQKNSDSDTRPNIIYILTDDLGIGDVQFFNPQGKVKTPNIDRLGREGKSFTDAHSSSAVCTPSRYSILTGRYAWRTKLASGVLHGFDPPLIDASRLTVGKLLQQNGYTTACIGKWHLGMDWPLAANATTEYDYTKAIKNGPTTRGFDYFFGIASSLDIPPFIYIENEHTVGVPTVIKKWVRSGPAEKDFDAVNCVPDFTAKAVNYIKDKSAKKQPFFLYLALPSPHTPIVPNKAFKGTTGVTDYGDYVAETDWSVGQVLKVIKESGISKNTIVVFTSDNGFAPYVLKNFNVEALGHFPSYIYRGYKSDIWEGGHRIPFIVRWPGKIKAGTSSDKTICLSDFMATTAAIIHAKLPDNSAEDSYNLLPYLTGSVAGNIREATVHHSIDGYFAIRQGKWKLELCPGSGGWESPKNGEAFKLGLPPVQLYDMTVDVREKNNVEAQHPDIVKNLTALLEKYVKDGRSTPGKPQSNDAKVDIWKLHYKGAGIKDGD